MKEEFYRFFLVRNASRRVFSVCDFVTEHSKDDIHSLTLYVGIVLCAFVG